MKKLSLLGMLMLSVSAFASADTLTFSSPQLQQDNIQWVDTRASEYYNGWHESGAANGGHIKGAKHIAANWLNELDDEEFKQFLNDRIALDKSKDVYLYGANAQTEQVQSALQKLGFKVHTVNDPLDNWKLDLVSLPHYQKLVSARWVKDWLDKKEDLERPVAKNARLVEVGWGSVKKAQYAVGHIPGALYLDTNKVEAGPLWNRLADDTLKANFAELGIDVDTPVIVYGRDTSGAARVAQLMMAMGVKEVRILDGGWKAWSDADYPQELMFNQAEPKAVFGDAQLEHALVIDTPRAKELLKDQQGASLVSIRTWPEFIGETSGYNYIDGKGRIPGAKWGRSGSDPYHLEDYRNPDNTMRSADEIQAMLAEWNIHKDQDVAFFCGTGWRASEVFFYAHAMGWPRVSVYDGGWYEWSEDPSNPIESGDIQPPMKK